MYVGPAERDTNGPEKSLHVRGRPRSMPNAGDDVTLATMISKGAGCDDRGAPYAYGWSIVRRITALNASAALRSLDETR